MFFNLLTSLFVTRSNSENVAAVVLGNWGPLPEIYCKGLPKWSCFIAQQQLMSLSLNMVIKINLAPDMLATFLVITLLDVTQ